MHVNFAFAWTIRCPALMINFPWVVQITMLATITFKYLYICRWELPGGSTLWYLLKNWKPEMKQMQRYKICAKIIVRCAIFFSYRKCENCGGIKLILEGMWLSEWNCACLREYSLCKYGITRKSVMSVTTAWEFRWKQSEGFWHWRMLYFLTRCQLGERRCFSPGTKVKDV